MPFFLNVIGDGTNPPKFKCITKLHEYFCVFLLNNEEGRHSRKQSVECFRTNSPLVSFFPMSCCKGIGTHIEKAAKVLVKPFHKGRTGIRYAHNGDVSITAFPIHYTKVSFPVQDASKICQFIHKLNYITKGLLTSTPLKTCNDYPVREYSQAAGSAHHPFPSKGDDIVSTAWQHAAALQQGGLSLANSSEGLNKNQLGVSAGAILGVKKIVFNSKDFSTIVVSSYATAP